MKLTVHPQFWTDAVTPDFGTDGSVARRALATSKEGELFQLAFATYFADMTLVSLKNVLLADHYFVATFAYKAEHVFLVFKLGLVIVIKDSVVT